MQGWRSRSDQDRYGSRDLDDPYTSDRTYGGGQQHEQRHDYADSGREYGQYGLHDRDDQRYGSRRPSGLDRDYRGAGYAGPGGYGGGFGGQDVGRGRGQYGGGQRENQHFDPDYDQWRREQLRALDDDYNQWREDRFKKFSDEFSTWRSSRAQRSETGNKNEGGSTTPGKPNKDGNS